MKLPSGALEANMKRARDERAAKKVVVPMSYLTALQNRGQNGEPILRGRKQTSTK
jgi:hypothetical protein